MARASFLAMRLAGLVLALVLTTRAEVARAQDALDDQYETWFGGFFGGPIAGPLYTHSDVHYRGWDDFSPHWILVRPGLSLRLMDGMFVTLGYAWTPSWGARGAERFTDEHRIWEQWMWEIADGPSAIRFQIRTRVEERFRSEVEVGMRLRQMLRLSVPLTPDRALTFVLWDEAFFDLNDTTVTRYQRAGFGQNRLFCGFGWQVVPATLRFEAGYFNQWIQRAGNPLGDAVNHTAMLNTYVGWR
jgi:hypothetical protein